MTEIETFLIIGHLHRNNIWYIKAPTQTVHTIQEMGFVFSKVEAPPPTFDIGKLYQYPRIQDLIFSFLDFEIKPGGLEPTDLPAVRSSSPVNYPLALEYYRRVNYILSPTTLRELEYRERHPEPYQYLQDIKHLIIRWEPTTNNQSFRNLANNPLTNMQPRNKLETITLDLYHYCDISHMERTLNDDVVHMIRELVRVSKGRVREVKLIVPYRKWNPELEIMKNHLSWRLRIKRIGHNHVHTAGKIISVWTWEGDGKDIADAILRTDAEEEPNFLGDW